MFETIRVELKNNVAWIIMNRPDKLNAFTEQMNKEIAKALKQANSDSETRAVVITGEGRAFSSGQDLAEVDENMDHGEVLRTRYGPMMKALATCEKPVIAAVNGVAAGAGFSLALACDFRLVSEKASFVQAFIHVGLVPDSGNLYFLPKLIGNAKALELAVFGEKVKADEAKELGLATKVFSMDEWESEVSRFAERIASMPTQAIALIKRSISAGWNMNYDDYLEHEAYCQRIAGLSIDHKEGVTSFIEKRKPAFQGK
ncbi:1,2-epoxyphenylacetyl-CoA isomerase [Bacillus sp. THAF10]|uniref:enoyl-CoA hydratase-related protein n=1 Tax=Bacillus sp. THAF10 TaxID=2587848 RepID=UPI001268B596|nr:enoyl-CoA hydratase-related protein [Bacillus sp. THAF10]QFT89234.1 1,2-epoxyphenylacetyl-CoA isomerase [Bacillus sp. THAF10]